MKTKSKVDRTELNMDQAWAETGDRYMLKLFRDYIFHQVNSKLVQPNIRAWGGENGHWNYLCPLQVMEDGRPFLDMAHVITSLNRLDAGIPDKVLKLSNCFSCRNISQLFRCVWCRGTNLMFWWWAMLSSKTAWNRCNWFLIYKYFPIKIIVWL